jgi:zinc transporter ZupT
MFGGMGTAAALTLHRAIEGATLALTGSVVVVLALMVHSASEGLALAALLDMARQRLAPWLVVACLSPAAGVLVAELSPLPEHVIPLLLGTVAGVLLRIAVVGVRLAAAQRQGGLRRRHVAVAVAAAVALGTLLTTARAVQGQAASRAHRVGHEQLR